MYANRLSRSSIESDYPSSLSTSLHHSALGLTDSPLPTLVMPTQSSPSTPSSARRQVLRERQSVSRTNLRQAASSSSLRPIPETSARRGSASRPLSTSDNPPPTPSKEKPMSLTPKALERHNAMAQPKHGASSRRGAASPSPARPASQNRIHRKPPPVASTVARIEPDEDIAQRWEEELVRGAKHLRIDDEPARAELDKERMRSEQRQKDAEWEKSGMWETQQNAEREAEDRTRRESGREKAYPPNRPKVPVRAAAAGVTSVHIGVRPRLHPSLSAHSIERNQPDSAVPPPLFSPESRAQRNLTRDMDVYKKAQEEYENWLAKKKEREGGMDAQDGGYGTRDWVPRDRVVARPGALPNLLVDPQGAGPSRTTNGTTVCPTINVPVPTSRLDVPVTMVHPATPDFAPSTAGTDDSIHAVTPQQHDQPTHPQTWGYDPYRQMYQGWYPDPMAWQGYGQWDPNQYWTQYMQAQAAHGLSEGDEKQVHFGEDGQVDPAQYDP